MLSWPKHAGWKIALAAVVIAVIGAAFAYFGLSPHGGSGEEPLPGTEAVGAGGRLKILADTDIVQTIYYTRCGDQENLSSKPSPNLVGLTPEQLQQVYPGWTINHFDTRTVGLFLKVDGLCREHANHMYIGMQDGKVAVFFGKPGDKPVLKELTEIVADHLPAQDREELEQGLIVESKEELLRTLEGMQAR